VSTTAWLLILVVGTLAGAVGGYWQGDIQGAARTVAAKNAKDLKSLQGLIDSQQSLIAAAGQASRDMRRAVSQRLSADAQSSKEFRDALSQTAGDRAGCLFPTDSMRQLADAERRAAEAAAGGIRRSVPGTAPGADRP
jgi:hypothetical protein